MMKKEEVIEELFKLMEFYRQHNKEYGHYGDGVADGLLLAVSVVENAR